jgi:hypothetical protein
MRSARDDVRGRNHVSNNNAREGASGNLKSNKKEKEEGAEAAGTTKRTRESHENSSNNASNVARGKRKARDSNNNAKGGARSVMKRNKGGNENENKKREEDANAGETLRSMKETLDSSINNASSVVRGKNKANVSNNNAKGGNFFDFLRTLRDN